MLSWNCVHQRKFTVEFSMFNLGPNYRKTTDLSIKILFIEIFTHFRNQICTALIVAIAYIPSFKSEPQIFLRWYFMTGCWKFVLSSLMQIQILILWDYFDKFTFSNIYRTKSKMMAKMYCILIITCYV